MLGDAGSIASLAGVAVSLVGLGFAILQLIKLRGETRAAQEAAEATRRTLGRELTISDVTRTFEQVEVAKQSLRERQWSRSLSSFPGIRRTLISIRYRSPGLSQHHVRKLQAAVEFLELTEHTVDTRRDNIAVEAIEGFIQGLIELQTTVAEMESQLFEADQGGR